MHSHVIAGYSMPKIQAAALVFCICHVAFTFTARLLHFSARLFNAAAGDPSRLPYYAKHSRIARSSPRRRLYRLEIISTALIISNR